MSQHASLEPERWARFDVDQQVLMIANEMHRTTRRLDGDDPEAWRRGYERVLRLTDLTATPARPALRRELLRWRDLVAMLYIADHPDPKAHGAAFRALLQLRPASARQIPLLTG